MCCLLVSGLLTEMTQQIHSLRASGVIFSHFARAAGSEMRTFLKSAGTACTAPRETALLVMDFSLYPTGVVLVRVVGNPYLTGLWKGCPSSRCDLLSERLNLFVRNAFHQYTLMGRGGVQTMGKLGSLLRFRLYSSWTLSFLLGVASCFSLVPGALFFAEPLAAQTLTPPQYPALPSETPTEIQPVTGSFDYARREVMIPMRDRVKLHTVMLVPKGSKNAPILLTRTPYNADELTTHINSSHLGPNLYGYDNATNVILEGGYIRVIQDIRGKYGSEGDYVMNRPLHGPQNPTPVDHATDTYDTIDWLVKNTPESNGKVGILGISYDGFTPLMALVNPHPALKVSVPMNPMVDGWMGDDWFHNGAFREQGMSYIYEQEATRDNRANWWISHFDDYDEFMAAGSAGELGRQHGIEQVGFWRKLLEHPSYDAFWQEQARDKILAAQPLKVPVMLVDSLWDQEDIYGAPAVYKAIKPKDSGNDKVFLVLGPWHHGQEIGDGSTLGPLRFGSDTGLYFRREILAPFLAQYLKDGAPKAEVAPVSAFETGTNKWLHLASWPAGCASGCGLKPTALYLGSGLKGTFAGGEG